MELAVPGRPVFVGIETSSYSGATLLAFLLNAHPRIASIGEMNGLIPSENPDLYFCSCGQRIKNCEFWLAVAGEMRQRGFDFDVSEFRTEFHLGGSALIQRLRAGSFGHRTLDAFRDMVIRTLPGERQQFIAQVARNKAFVETVLKLTDKWVFVDSSKDHLRARALKMFSPYDVRIIHLIRDPRGVVASRLRRGVRIDEREAARQWVRLHQRLELAFDPATPAKYFPVRYEDLATDPQAMLKKLYAFCGVDPEYPVADLTSSIHHIVGNAMRLDNLAVIKRDDGWRKLLSKEQQDEIWKIAGPLAAQYGYT
jgi:hypothetical protein